MWLIIIFIILIAVGALFYFGSNQISDAHLSRGGLRMSFPVFTSLLEQSYKMSFINDTGRQFHYSKQININGHVGTLISGIKLNMADEPLIFSECQWSNGEKIKGLDIKGVDFTSSNSIEEGLKISIDKIGA